MTLPATATMRPPPSIEAVLKRRRPLADVNKLVAEAISPLERLAVWITVRVGSMGFFLAIVAWTVLWLGWNLLAPAAWQFDPPMAFVFWLFISNVIQIMLMPLIMVGQNLLGRHAEARAEHDLEVNIKAEQEIEVVLRHLEYQSAILIAMLEKLGISVEEIRQRTGQ
ncbi:MAG: DUF1003 domain-containing protein [Nevskiales bacterium]